MDILQLETAMTAFWPEDKRQAATAEALARMERVAPLPHPLRKLYERDMTLYTPGFELFEPAIYEDVNRDRGSFGHFEEMVFFADDQSDGFYFLDPSDLLGLGPEFVYWVDRGDMAVDEVVPLAEDLPSFLDWTREGETASNLKPLSARSLERLKLALATPPESVQFGPPIDWSDLRRAQTERQVLLTMTTGRILMMANGMIFTKTGRQIYPLDKIVSIAGGYVALLGHDPSLGHLGVTLGGWQSLPPDRLISFRDETKPEEGQVLGRMSDVLTFWISETTDE